MKNASSKKTIRVALLILNSLLLSVSILFFVSGSLELFPTPEQEEKMKIVMGGLSFIFFIIEVMLFFRIFNNKSQAKA